MVNNILQNDILRVVNEDYSWDKLNNKTVLITGATGFVGSFIVDVLLKRAIMYNQNIKVVALVRNKERGKIIFNDYLNTGLLEFLEQDIRSEINYNNSINYIIHAASNAAPREYASDPCGTMTTNLLGTTNLLEFARKSNISNFLYLSTIEVYGNVENKETISETDFGYINSTNVRSCYPLSKKVCETLCISYFEQYGIPINIGRLSYLFGPGMKQNDSKVVAEFTRNIANNKNLVLKSKGEQLRSYCYISDAVSGLIKILLDGDKGQAYNIASKLCIVTIANMANNLVSLYPDKKLQVIFDIPTEKEIKAFSPIKNAVLNTTKIESLGWKSKVTLLDGLRYTVESLQ